MSRMKVRMSRTKVIEHRPGAGDGHPREPYGAIPIILQQEKKRGSASLGSESSSVGSGVPAFRAIDLLEPKGEPQNKLLEPK